MSQRIYCDHNASTPLCAEARQAILQAMDQGAGNPSAAHWAGRQARDLVEQAREQVAAAIGAQCQEIIFTSGGSESLNQAIFGLCRGQPRALAHSAIEHPAVQQPAQVLQQQGWQRRLLPVGHDGVVDLAAAAELLGQEVALCALMHANNETGAIQPLAQVAELTQQHGIPLLCDAAQSLGKIPVAVADLGCDLLVIAGHKFGAPKGVGALWLRPGLNLPPLIHGAGHESGRRAGTENVMLIAALGAAAAALPQRLQAMQQVAALRDQLEQELQRRWPQQVVIHAQAAPRIPNTCSVGFVGRQGQALLQAMPELAASTGSACHAGETRLSPVLSAMGVDTAAGLGTLRLSLGPENGAEDIPRLLSLLQRALDQEAPA